MFWRLWNWNWDEIFRCRSDDLQIEALMVFTRPMQCHGKFHGPEYRNRLCDLVRTLFVVLRNRDGSERIGRDRRESSGLEITEVSTPVVDMIHGEDALSRRRSGLSKTFIWISIPFNIYICSYIWLSLSQSSFLFL
jgi:hypothetical protein